jgi:hypothetical protein
MKKIFLGIAGAVLLWLGAAVLSYGCGTYTSQRAYLDRCFWQPFTQYVKQTVQHWRSREPEVRAFAGYAGTASASALLAEARSAYCRLGKTIEELGEDMMPNEVFEMLPFDAVRKSIEKARSEKSLTSEEKDELELLAAKVDLREGSIGDKERLLSAQSRLRAFLQRAATSPYRSEARGWLASACYRLGQYSEAAKIYMNEYTTEDSNFESQSLNASLRLVFKKAKPTLAAHISEYFDTPEHALFVIQIISNPMFEGRDPQLMRQNGSAILREMEKHRHLFAKKEDAEKLALAMMRVSLAMGDMGRLLQYAGEIPAASKAAKTMDYYWMVGCANFLSRNFAAAEPPLRKMLTAPDASLLRKGKAAMALVGVYDQLHRPLDKLDAALKWEEIQGRHAQIENGAYMAADKDQNRIIKRHLPDEPWANDEPSDFEHEMNPLMPFVDLAFDLSILLESELTIEQLQQYYDAHPKSDPIVPYSLAVRYARREKYDQAARLYERAGDKARPQRMMKLQALYDATQARSRTPEEIQQGRFDYALFLSRNTCRVFFNDRLWPMIQGFYLRDTKSLIADEASEYEKNWFDWPQFSLSREERDRVARQLRILQDEQEEYWRAYHIFNEIVNSAGATSLGRQAAREAIRCLDHINPRFGRKEEIEAEINRLIKWLKSSHGLH